MDREGAAGPADVAIAGDEADVERQISVLADVGATDFVAWTFPAGEDAQPSLDRTWPLVKGLVGKV